MSDSVRPYRRQPTRLPRPWDSPGKNTGVGCHFLLQCMKVKSESEVAQSCLTLSDPMDCSLLGSSTHGIFQARVLEWGAIAFSAKSHAAAAAAAAKSLQSCPTLCDPIDGSSPGSPIPGTLQARTLEWVAISFSNAWKWKWSCSVVSNSSWPHGLQPTSVLCPWDLPGKSTGVGCHCLLRQSHTDVIKCWKFSVNICPIALKSKLLSWTERATPGSVQPHLVPFSLCHYIPITLTFIWLAPSIISSVSGVAQRSTVLSLEVSALITSVCTITY